MLEASADGKRVADEDRRKLAEVRRRLEQRDHGGGAEYFVERIALGPGVWAQLPPTVRERFLRYAPTYLGELRDPDALRVDLDSLRGLTAGVLITEGDRSLGLYAPIIERLANVLPDVHRHTIRGAGHIPHTTHPHDFAEAIRSFLLEEYA